MRLPISEPVGHSPRAWCPRDGPEESREPASEAPGHRGEDQAGGHCVVSWGIVAGRSVAVSRSRL